MHGRWRVGVAVAATLVAAACGREQSSGAAAPIRIGHFASLTGDTATFGRSTDNGIRMQIEEVNDRGGVLGRPLELVTEDDRSVTEEARTAAQKLLQPSVHHATGERAGHSRYDRPGCFGGQWLGHFQHGERSGWFALDG